MKSLSKALIVSVLSLSAIGCATKPSDVIPVYGEVEFTTCERLDVSLIVAKNYHDRLYNDVNFKYRNDTIAATATAIILPAIAYVGVKPITYYDVAGNVIFNGVAPAGTALTAGSVASLTAKSITFEGDDVELLQQYAMAKGELQQLLQLKETHCKQQ